MRKKKPLLQQSLSFLLAVILTAGLIPPAYMEGWPWDGEVPPLEETEEYASLSEIPGPLESTEEAGLDDSDSTQEPNSISEISEITEGTEEPEEAKATEETETQDAELSTSSEAEASEDVPVPDPAEQGRDPGQAQTVAAGAEEPVFDELIIEDEAEDSLVEEEIVEEEIVEEQIVEEEILSESAAEATDGTGDAVVGLAAKVIARITDVFYNAFELGLLPVVRRQQPYGDCWAFAGIGALETDLIADENADTSIDLSEYFLAYYLSHGYPYPKQGGEGDTIEYEGSGSPLDNGGNNYMVFRMLASLIGTVSEADAPYPSRGVEELPVRYAPIAAQITGAYLIDPNDREAVKQAILDHGGVSASINMVTETRSYAGGKMASFRSNGDKSCLYGDYSGITHDVMLVGWDDEFAVSNFNEAIQPPEPGAWLVRNSWGYNGYGSDGYFWISYYDASLLRNKTTAYDADNTDASDFCYSYDKTPYPASRYLVSNRATVRQTFSVDGHELLQAVGVETASDNLSLAVSLKIGGEEIASGTVLAPYEGFYRITLNTPYELLDTADVEVSVTLTSLEEGGEVRVPFARVGSSTQGQIQYTNVSGEGGFWFNNRWYEGDSRLKLYTKKSALPGEIETLVLSETELSLLSGETAALTAILSPDDPVNPEIRWTSSDPRIADVNAEGIITAGRAEGTAAITAMTNRGVYAVCMVDTTYRDLAVLKSGNVEFDGLIHMLIKYDLTGIREEYWDRSYIAFYRDGVLLEKWALTDYESLETQEKEDGMHTYARYTCPVPVEDYLEPIIIRAEDAEGREIATVTESGRIVEDGFVYSLDTYAENKIRNGSERMKRMAQALKDYGIAAILFLGKDAGGQTVSPAVINLDLDSIAINETTTAGRKPEGVSASQNVEFEFDNSLIINFYLPDGKGPEDYSFLQDGAAVFPMEEEDPVTGAKRVRLIVTSIAPDELNILHSFSVSDGENTFEISTSALGYAKRRAERGSANMQVLAKALCNYYVEALRYFHS